MGSWAPARQELRGWELMARGVHFGAFAPLHPLRRPLASISVFKRGEQGFLHICPPPPLPGTAPSVASAPGLHCVLAAFCLSIQGVSTLFLLPPQEALNLLRTAAKSDSSGASPCRAPWSLGGRLGPVGEGKGVQQEAGPGPGGGAWPGPWGEAGPALCLFRS